MMPGRQKLKGYAMTETNDDHGVVVRRTKELDFLLDWCERAH